ncbi:acireductone synthase [Acidicapsa ligni]|uniref:acireductone synthase n=1 Tax=Acidicapsa ligni TaxID=542300 RepID=UPI0021E03B73|nr:acireductone synthase [Acidicapsa ligni]
MGFPPPKVYLLDVEGTTSPISLVYEQLFPYARKHIESFLRSHIDEPGLRADLAAFGEADADPEQRIATAMHHLLDLMDRDVKDPLLKKIQGQVWNSGFLSGELIGTVFPDVAPAFARWSKKARVAIYSSGSVEAQQLLFGHSSAGDLRPYISAYFDTRSGPKTSPESYRVIANCLGVETGEILFVSDVVRELGPAREAGCQAALSLREGNQPVSDRNGHIAAASFEELL